MKKYLDLTHSLFGGAFSTLCIHYHHFDYRQNGFELINARYNNAELLELKQSVIGLGVESRHSYTLQKGKGIISIAGKQIW